MSSGAPEHSLVVGGGIGGMSMALLLAAAGQKVTLIEATPKIGGFMQRFRRQGIPFDTGFHFTGGFENILSQMLEVLNISDIVRESPFRSKIFLRPTQRLFCYPTTGVEDLADYLATEFPEAHQQIYRYYQAEKAIIRQTPMFDLRDDDLINQMQLHEFDFLTLDDFFNQLGITGELRAVLASAAMCHGTPPCESTVTNHCRVSYGLGNHIAQVQNGGEAFIDGFKREAARNGIKIMTSTRITRCRDVVNRQCREVELNNGQVIHCDKVFFAVHPREILAALPPELTPAHFRRRVKTGNDSCSFFSIFGVLPEGDDGEAELTSFLSDLDLNNILLPARGGYGIGIVFGRELDDTGHQRRTVTAFRSVFPESTGRWTQLAGRTSDSDYQKYKAELAEQILEDVYLAYPECRGKIQLLASSSALTCRDYVPPTGCAYGVRQEIGRARIFGRLPVRNFYAIGHSSLIPGAVGAMMASFLLFRQLFGEEVYKPLIKPCSKRFRV